MPRVFISYRRSQAGQEAGRLFDERALGAKNVFKDVDVRSVSEKSQDGRARCEALQRRRAASGQGLALLA